MKYKVGDRVRVREDLVVAERYYSADRSYRDSFVDEMADFKGQVVTIEATHGQKYRIVGSSFNWVDEMFEGLAEQPKIVITTDGKTTLARLYEGKKVVKRAEAKCSPSDTFDFMTGAKLALERLAVEHEPTAPTFAEGDIVRVVRTAGPVSHFYDIGTVAKVRGVEPDGYTTVLYLVSDGLFQSVCAEDVEKINF